MISDHHQPWMTAQGHSGYAWSILGAAAQATERIGLMSYVTCPTMRYHPAVVAQKASTMQILSKNRFGLGLDAGFSEVVLVQIGAEQQQPFIDCAQESLRPALRSL